MDYKDNIRKYGGKPETYYIGICARAGGKQSGKDTFAKYLKSEIESQFPNSKVDIMHFADALKEACSIIFGISMDLIHGTEKDKNTLTDWDWPKGTDKEGQKMTVREILQFVGTEMFRNTFDGDIWVKSLASNSKGGFMIVPDVRFLNEASFVSNYWLIDIVRDTGNSDTHRSEMESKNIPDEMISYSVDNNGDLESLKIKAKDIAKDITDSFDIQNALGE